MRRLLEVCRGMSYRRLDYGAELNVFKKSMVPTPMLVFNRNRCLTAEVAAVRSPS
jgi:hypothetical protein